MNEIGVVKILYKYKLRLLIITLVAGTAAAGYSLMKSNRYSSTAAISVQRPEVTITGEVPPLNVETLRALIESTRVKWELFQELMGTGMLAEDSSFPGFQKTLSTSIERDTSRDKNLLPMVKLTATTDDPELSMVIANRWADVVLKKTRKIYQSGVDELSIFTTNIYEEISKSLLESEDEYTKTMLESNLTVNKILLKRNQELYEDLAKGVLTLEGEVATKKALLENIKKKLAEQEIDGIWVGQIFARKYEEDPEYAFPETAPLVDRIARTIRSLKRNEKALSEFEESSRIDYKHTMLKIKKYQIEDISQNIMDARTSLFSAAPVYSTLQKELDTIDPKVVLSKAIGDAELWDRYLKGELPDAAELPSMKTEESNTIYLETKKRMVSLSGEISGLKSKISEGEKELESLRKVVSQLKKDLAPLEAKRGELLRAIKKDQDMLSYYEKAYNTARQGYETGESELNEMTVKLEAKKVKSAAIREEIAVLEKKVFNSENQIARQKRDVDNLTKVRASLAAKAEEVALLRVSMENVSRSGTVLLYRAQADPIKVGPQRSRSVIISMLLAFVISSILCVLYTVARDT